VYKNAAQKLTRPKVQQKQLNVNQVGLQDRLIYPTKTPSSKSLVSHPQLQAWTARPCRPGLYTELPTMHWVLSVCRISYTVCPRCCSCLVIY